MEYGGGNSQMSGGTSVIAPNNISSPNSKETTDVGSANSPSMAAGGPLNDFYTPAPLYQTSSPQALVAAHGVPPQQQQSMTGMYSQGYGTEMQQANGGGYGMQYGSGGMLPPTVSNGYANGQGMPFATTQVTGSGGQTYTIPQFIAPQYTTYVPPGGAPVNYLPPVMKKSDKKKRRGFCC